MWIQLPPSQLTNCAVAKLGQMQQTVNLPSSEFVGPNPSSTTIHSHRIMVSSLDFHSSNTDSISVGFTH